MKFNEMNLSAECLKAVELLGYDEMLPVQERVIPLMLARKDVFVQSKTGSGKTASYVIPEIEKIDWLMNEPQVLVLTPTRELAKQVQNEFKMLGAYARINAVAIFGKQPFKSQITALKQKVHVVVGTAGRILDHCERGTLDLSHVHTCILDEADEMLNLGFIDEVRSILSYLPKGCSMAMFSATVSPSIREVADQYLCEPAVVKVDRVELMNPNVESLVMMTSKERREEDLLHILYKEVPDQVIVFCNFRETVERVFDLLCEHRVSCLMIHGGLLQEERLANMRDFKRGKYRVLVATDVAGRGIDVANVSHVINFEFPTTCEDFVHRVGRCGRVDNKGRAFSLVLPTQGKYLELVQEGVDRFFEIVDGESAEYRDAVYSEKLGVSVPVREKNERIRGDVMKLFFKAGKDKKVRAKDLVGAIMSVEGVVFEDIGVIEVLDAVSYVEILNGKGDLVLKGMRGKTVKNKRVAVAKAREEL